MWFFIINRIKKLTKRNTWRMLFMALCLPVREWNRALDLLSTRVISWRWLLSWWRTPGFKASLPSVLAVIIVPTMLARLELDSANVPADYKNEADAAWREGDFPRALICYKRLSADDNRPEFLYRIMSAYDAQHLDEQAVAIAREIAPESRCGHGPAHAWMARRLLADGLDANRLRAWKHLQYAVTSSPVEIETHRMLVDLAVQLGRASEAERSLRTLAETDPLSRLLLAHLLSLQGDSTAARIEAEKATDALKATLARNLDDIKARVLAAKAFVFLRRFQEAEELLQPFVGGTHGAAARVALAEILLARFDLSKGETLEARGEYLRRALEVDRWNIPVWSRLMTMQRMDSDSRMISDRLVATQPLDDAPAPVYALLGSVASASDDHPAARRHWLRALALDANLLPVANNLAWDLANHEPMDLQEALNLIDSALDYEPDRLEFVHTRAYIFMASSRWEEAARDLERVTARRVDPECFMALARCYDSLGRAEDARLLRSLVPNVARVGGQP